MKAGNERIDALLQELKELEAEGKRRKFWDDIQTAIAVAFFLICIYLIHLINNMRGD
jgi:hypothetical protein